MSGALIKACSKSLSIQNTGSECDESMGPASLLIAVPKTLKWNATNMANFAGYLNTQIHAAKATRIYPLFGPAAPIRKITLSKESDVISTQEDGTPIFIRYGLITRAFATTDGGICFAKALQSLNKAGYSIVEIDNANQVLCRDNKDGTYSGLQTTFMYSPSPDFPDFKNPSYSNFQITYTPAEFVNFGVIFQGDASISNLIGLFDAQVTDATGSSVTKLKIGVSTICGGTDLIAEFGAALAAVGNFVVTLDSSGAVQTITAAAIVAGHIELTGTFVSGSKYDVTLAPPATLLAALVPGIEGVVPAVITIP